METIRKIKTKQNKTEVPSVPRGKACEQPLLSSTTDVSYQMDYTGVFQSYQELIHMGITQGYKGAFLLTETNFVSVPSC